MPIITNPLYCRLFINSGDHGGSESFALATWNFDLGVLYASALAYARSLILSELASIEWAVCAQGYAPYCEQCVITDTVYGPPQWGSCADPREGLLWRYEDGQGNWANHLFKSIDSRFIKNLSPEMVPHVLPPGIWPLPANIDTASTRDLFLYCFTTFRQLTARVKLLPGLLGGQKQYALTPWAASMFRKVSSKNSSHRWRRVSWEPANHANAPDFTPCGEAVSVLHECYVAPCRWYANGSVQAIRYYWSQPGATVLDVPHIFWGRARGKQIFNSTGPGEITGHFRRSYSKGIEVGLALGNHYAGQPVEFMGAAVVPWTPEFPTPADNLPACDTPVVPGGLFGPGGLALGGPGVEPAPVRFVPAAVDALLWSPFLGPSHAVDALILAAAAAGNSVDAYLATELIGVLSHRVNALLWHVSTLGTHVDGMLWQRGTGAHDVDAYLAAIEHGTAAHRVDALLWAGDSAGNEADALLYVSSSLGHDIDALVLAANVPGSPPHHQADALLFAGAFLDHHIDAMLCYVGLASYQVDADLRPPVSFGELTHWVSAVMWASATTGHDVDGFFFFSDTITHEIDADLYLPIPTGAVNHDVDALVQTPAWPANGVDGLLWTLEDVGHDVDALLSSGAPTISLIQGRSANGGNGTSINPTLISTSQPGNLLVLYVVYWGTSNPAPTFPADWILAAEAQLTRTQKAWIYIYPNALATLSVTVNFASAATGSSWVMLELSPGPLAGTVDTSASNSGSSASPDSGTTPVTSSAIELALALVTTFGAGNFVSGPTGGFTEIGGFHGSGYVLFGYGILSATGTQDCGGTTSATVSWAGCIATIK